MKLIDLQKSVQELPRLTDIRQFGRSPEQRAVLEPLLTHLGVKPVRVDDVTNMLGLNRGRVFAIRWDITSGEMGFKQPVMSSLLLFHLWRRRTLLSNVQVLIDAGNVNTSLALTHLAASLDLRAEHILSRHFPEDIRSYMLKHGHDSLTLIEAPPSKTGKEREFYSFLLELMRDVTRRRTHLCLWHAKYSGVATRWMGEAFSESWQVMPDDIVLGLGSGSTLEGYAIPLKQRFNNTPRIVVAEHQHSPLVSGKPVIANLFVNSDKQPQDFKEYRQSPTDAIPHMVLGPHYDEINPLISGDGLAQISAVVRYSDLGWQEISLNCRLADMPIGNSSAANLAVARYLASQGRIVFTFIYEPLRDFYIKQDVVDENEKRREQVLVSQY
ncbi:MAG: PLP-dependent lyase/thiolase [Planctomycetes bacterium]|nr:PLP-dependent lyase/thiolase [Planctomycetota bacterium]